MKTIITIQRSKKTQKKYICMKVGEVIVFLDQIQLMKILKMNPYEISCIMAQDDFVYDINEERRID